MMGTGKTQVHHGTTSIGRIGVALVGEMFLTDGTPQLLVVRLTNYMVLLDCHLVLQHYLLRT